MKTEYEKVLLPNSVQQELEKLRTQAIADAAEIARLQSGFDELRKSADKMIVLDVHTDFDIGWRAANRRMLHELNRITGVEQ